MRPDLVRRTTTTRIPTDEGTFQLSHYIDTRDGKEHLALVMGEVRQQSGVLTRVHSECFTGDVLGSQRCDCGEQLHEAMRRVAEAGQGVILYLRQEGRGIGLEQKLKAYNLQDQGYDTVDANLMLGHQADEREYSAAAAILQDLQVGSIRLMTNNPAKIDHLADLGITIVERLPLTSTVTKDNAAYLATKVQRMRHLLALPLYSNGHGHGHNLALVEPQAESGLAIQLAALHARIDRHFTMTGRPFVTLSYAQTLNGTIGSNHGGPLQISGAESMHVTHALRALHDAILVGIGTVLADDPRLTARVPNSESPQPVIVDSQLRTPLTARLWSHPKAPWFATRAGSADQANVFRTRGASIIDLAADASGRVELDALLKHLATAGIRSVMVEGGAQIITNLLQRQLADFAVVTVAPRFIPGISVIDSSCDAMAHIASPAYLQAGPDMLLWGEMHNRNSTFGQQLSVPTVQEGMVAKSPVTSAL